MHGIVWPFATTAHGNEPVFEGTDETSEQTRCIFPKITPTSFHWRAVASDGGGRHWRLQQEMRATRAERH